MIEWRDGGWTGSINRLARKEVREQLRENLVARRVRYTISQRALRHFFGSGTFGRFICFYTAVNVIFVLADALTGWLRPTWITHWRASETLFNTETEDLILNVSGYLLGAQVGALTVISLALALVTLIAQREGSSTDVQVYYHEAFAFELVASSVALVAILCFQLLWPFQSLLHLAGLGTELPQFKLALLSLHLAWLLVNLAAVAYFIGTTFRFVQQSKREILRERYTANVVLPYDLVQRLRQQFYATGSRNLLDVSDDNADQVRPSVMFGFDFGAPRDTELENTFEHPMVLQDVRMTWVRWVLTRWSSRCVAAAAQQAPSQSNGVGHLGPQIRFTPHIDRPLTGKVEWCLRRGGVPLNRIERLVLRRAFRFGRSRDEN